MRNITSVRRVAAWRMFLLVFWGLWCLPALPILAQPSVKIVLVEPDVRDQQIAVGAFAEIKCIAQATPAGGQITWSHRGPGSFDGSTQGLASIYLLPAQITGKAEQVTLTVTVTNARGETARAAFTFTLTAPVVAMTPTPPARPTLTPPPKSAPSPTPTSKPTLAPVRPRAKPTGTPSPAGKAPSEAKTPEELQQTLDQYVNTYAELKKEENRGQAGNRALIAAVRDLIRACTALEDRLEESFQASPQNEILQRIQRIQKLRQRYEQELLDRILREGQ